MSCLPNSSSSPLQGPASLEWRVVPGTNVSVIHICKMRSTVRWLLQERKKCCQVQHNNSDNRNTDTDNCISNSLHLLSVCCVPDPILNISCRLTHLILTTTGAQSTGTCLHAIQKSVFTLSRNTGLTP